MNKKEIEVITQPENQVPKICTSVVVTTLANNSGIILSFLYQDKFIDQEGNLQEGKATLINRIFFDQEHANQLYDVLEKTLKNKNS